MKNELPRFQQLPPHKTQGERVFGRIIFVVVYAAATAAVLLDVFVWRP